MIGFEPLSLVVATYLVMVNVLVGSCRYGGNRVWMLSDLDRIGRGGWSLLKVT
ncbi:MAG TPA: hypothetical protein VK901_14375 [Nitrospiraceae bacterium]|nr:hypothetical protein [Nitrospiraceae bacterium]